MVEHPLRLIEVGRDLGPVLVVGFEPDSPLAGVFAGEQLGQPRCPDVWELSCDGHSGTRVVCDCLESIFGRFSRAICGCHQLDERGG